MQLSLEFLALELAPPDTRRGLDKTCTLKFVPALLKHIKQHREILEQNKDTAAAEIILRNLRATIGGLVRKELTESSFSTSINDANVVFLCGGLMATIEQWNEDECRESIEHTVALIDTQIRSALNYLSK